MLFNALIFEVDGCSQQRRSLLKSNSDIEKTKRPSKKETNHSVNTNTASVIDLELNRSAYITKRSKPQRSCHTKLTAAMSGTDVLFQAIPGEKEWKFRRVQSISKSGTASKFHEHGGDCIKIRSIQIELFRIEMLPFCHASLNRTTAIFHKLALFD